MERALAENDPVAGTGDHDLLTRASEMRQR